MNGGIWRGTTSAADDIIPSPAAAQTTPPTFVAGAVSKVGTGAVSPSWPAEHASGQLGVMIVQTAAQSLGTLPTGWTRFSGSPWTVGTAGASGSVGIELLYKFAASSTEVAQSIGDSGDHQIARILTFSGVDPATVWNAISSSTVSTASTAVTFPTIAPNVANTRILFVVGNATDSSADQYGASYTNGSISISGHTNTNSSIGVGGGFAAGSGAWAQTGAIGTTTGTLLTASKQVCVVIALTPVPSTGGGTPGSSFPDTMFGSEGFDGASSEPCGDTYTSLLGHAVTPDTLIGDSNASAYTAATTGHFARLTSTGARAVIKVTPPNNSKHSDGTYRIRNPDGSFWPGGWMNEYDSWWTGIGSTGQSSLRTLVASGGIRYLYLLDDFGGTQGGNSFSPIVTQAQIESLAQHVKVTAPWLPCFARASLLHMRDIALHNGSIVQYVWLDAAQVAYVALNDWRKGATATVAANIQAGKDCGLAALGWNNILNWGRGLTSGWGCIQGDPGSVHCGQSPAEVLEACNALMDRSETHGLINWAYNFGCVYWNKTEIQAAFSTIAGNIVGRAEGPQNIRSGSTKHLDPA
jgi:hypothetical protein